MPPVGALTSNFTGDPLLQELVEARTSTLNPLDAATGAKATLVDGVAQPDLGSPEAPWGTGHLQRLVVAGVEVILQDIANFTPLLIKREGTAPLTGQHDQTFVWPFATLTRALAFIVSGQRGGGGGDGGFFCRPNFMARRRGTDMDTDGWYAGGALTTRTTERYVCGEFETGGGQRVPEYCTRFVYTTDGEPSSVPRGLYGGGDFIVDNAAAAQMGLLAGSVGLASSSSIILEGLSLGTELALSFGKGGAGGAGGNGATFPTSKSVEFDGRSYYSAGLNWTAGVAGLESTGYTSLTHALQTFIATKPNVDLAPIYASLGLPAGLDLTRIGVLPGGQSVNIAATGSSSDGNFAKNFHGAGGAGGAGGAAGLPAQGNDLLSAQPQANNGDPGEAGHDGFILLFPIL